MVKIEFYVENHYGKWQCIKEQFMSVVPRKSDLIKINRLTYKIRFIEYHTNVPKYCIYLC